MSSRHRPEGIVVRHSTDCESRKGGSCDCRPGYQAQVFSARDQNQNGQQAALGLALGGLSFDTLDVQPRQRRSSQFGIHQLSVSEQLHHGGD